MEPHESFEHQQDSCQDDDEDGSDNGGTHSHGELLALVRKSYLLYVASQTMAVPLFTPKRYRRESYENRSEPESDIETYADQLKIVCYDEYQPLYHVIDGELEYQDENTIKPGKKRKFRAIEPDRTIVQRCPLKTRFENGDSLEEPDRQAGDISALKDCWVELQRLTNEEIARFCLKKAPEEVPEEIAPCAAAKVADDFGEMDAVRRILSMVVGPFREPQPAKTPDEEPLSADEALQFEEIFGGRKNPNAAAICDDDDKTREFWESRRKFWVTDFKEDVREFLGFEPDSDGDCEEPIDECQHDVFQSQTPPRSIPSSGTVAKTPKWQKRTPRRISYSRRSGRAVRPPELVDL